MNRLIIALALATTAGVAVAQTQPAAPPAPRGEFPPPPPDPLGDKAVSRADYLAKAAERFDAMDTNHDGVLTAEERRAARPHRPDRGPPPGFAPPPPGERPGGPGADGRGPGSPGGGGFLARLDTDGDGRISRAEFVAPFDRLDRNHDGVIDASEMEGDGPGGRFLARLDTNGDGKVSRAEYEAPFARLDANGDGFIDQNEMAGLRGRFAGRGGRGGERN